MVILVQEDPNGVGGKVAFNRYIEVGDEIFQSGSRGNYADIGPGYAYRRLDIVADTVEEALEKAKFITIKRAVE